MQSKKLYDMILDFIAIKNTDVIYDLYSGIGTIANYLAQKAKKVCGIEYVPEAVKAAMTNAKINGIENSSFFAGDMKDMLNEDFVNNNGYPDLIITNPPRNGMHPGVIKTLNKIKAKQIVYVSCNSSTQARDLELLSEVYEVKKIRPIDMFPHTQHIENVVSLLLK